MNPENSQADTEKQENEKLLRLMTGYDQHARFFVGGLLTFSEDLGAFHLGHVFKAGFN